MKKNILFFILLFAFMGVTQAQLEKVSWNSSTEQIDDSTFGITLTADVIDGWYIYSQYMDDGGPIPTAINFTGKGFEVNGNANESGEQTKELFDPVFEIDIKKFGGKVEFKQLVKATSKSPQLTANVTFMTCNDEMCLPPQQIKIPVSLN